MPIEPKPIPNFKGKNKMERFLHQMQVQQNLILAKFGINAPIVDLLTINNNISNEDGDDNASVSKLLEADTKNTDHRGN